MVKDLLRGHESRCWMEYWSDLRWPLDFNVIKMFLKISHYQDFLDIVVVSNVVSDKVLFVKEIFKSV